MQVFRQLFSTFFTTFQRPISKESVLLQQPPFALHFFSGLGLSPLCTYPYRLWIAGVYGRWSYHQTRCFCHNTRNGHRNDCKYLFYSYIRNGKLPTCQQKCQKGLWLDSKLQGYIEHQTSPGRLLYRNWESRENVYQDEHQFE